MVVGQVQKGNKLQLMSGVWVRVTNVINTVVYLSNGHSILKGQEIKDWKKK